ncbi:site-2 protease family protein [Pyruvatibacter mobilis]|uniref:site-2 protease family protein n=1 Tax=Pyruvatibacter mobilis TaxID=1712261 RepID=UPI003BAA88E3
MFGKNLTLGRILGIEIRINVSWLFIAMLLSWALARGYFPAVHEGLQQIDYWSMGIVAVVGLFLSILLHELAHSVVAKAFGQDIKSITLWMLGGMAEMRDEPPSPRAEFLMAIAGPAASFVLAGLFHAIGAALAEDGSMALAGIVATYLGKLNLILAIFNLVPAFPLDGGRVARAALWAWTGDFTRATATAARMGSLFGLGLILLGVFALLAGGDLSGLWLVILGLFIRFAADASQARAETQHALEGEPLRRVMVPDPVVVAPDLTVAALIDGYIYRHAFEFFPVVEAGRLVGSVSLHEVRTVPPHARETTRVADILRPMTRDCVIDADASAAEALAHMQGTKRTLLMVVDGPRLVGVIALRDIMRLVSLKSVLAGTAHGD